MLARRVYPSPEPADTRAAKALQLISRARWVKEHKRQSRTGSRGSSKHAAAMSGSFGHADVELGMRRRMSLGRARTYDANASQGAAYEARFFQTFVVRKVWADAASHTGRRLHAWTLLNEPSSSRAAYVWWWVILAFSVFSSALLLVRSQPGTDEYHLHAARADLACNLLLGFDWALRSLLYASIELRCPPCAGQERSKARLPGLSALVLDGAALLPYVVVTRFGALSIRGSDPWTASGDEVSLYCEAVEETAARRGCVAYSLLAALRLLRLISLCRHYSGTRVLLLALRKSAAALAVPFVFLGVSGCCFAVRLAHAHAEELPCPPHRHGDPTLSPTPDPEPHTRLGIGSALSLGPLPPPSTHAHRRPAQGAGLPCGAPRARCLG